MFPYFFFLISLTALLIATYTDLKERIVPDKLTCSLIILGILLHLIYSITSNNPWIFIICIAVTLATFAAAYIFWRLGIWAGGDVKLITGLAALNPINYAVLRGFLGIKGSLFAAFGYELPVFPLSLFIFSLFSMLPYAILISVMGITRNRKLRMELNEQLNKLTWMLAKFGFVFAGLAAVLSRLQISLLFTLPLLLVLSFVGEDSKSVIAVLLMFFAVFESPFGAAASFVLLFVPLFFAYLVVRLFLISHENILKKNVRISELAEGTIVAETIVERNGRIERIEGFKIGKIINYLRNNDLGALMGIIKPSGRILADRMSAAGLTNEQVAALREALSRRQIEDRIKVKLSAPFVPAVLLAYLVLQAVGDLLWKWVFL